MNFKRGEYYIYYNSVLCYNSPYVGIYIDGHSLYDPATNKEIVLAIHQAMQLTPATKLDLLLRGLDENIRIPRSKTASTGKR